MAIEGAVGIAQGDLVFRRLDGDVEIAEGRSEGAAYPLESMAAGFVRVDAGSVVEVVNVNDEVLYLLEGRFEMACEGRSAVVDAGGLVYIRRGVSFKATFHQASSLLWVGHSSADVAVMLETWDERRADTT